MTGTVWRCKCRCGRVAGVSLLAAAAVLLVYNTSSSNNTSSSSNNNTSSSSNNTSFTSNNTSQAAARSRPKKILYWNNFFDLPHMLFGVGMEPFVASGCPVSNCEAEERSAGSGYHDADAIIFHGWELDALSADVRQLARSRRPHQRYVLFLMEAPGVYHTRLQDFPHFFNWTMTYRLDSDVYRPYGAVVPTNTASGFEDLRRASREPWKSPAALTSLEPSSWPARPGLVAWLASKCRTNSRREAYVRELGRHISVDVHGGCGPHKCPGRMSDQCYRMLERKYLFYLSFENSLCTDYVTEKLFRVLQYRMVPVVYGGADYSRFAPPGSYIDTRDFASPKMLADHLKRLAADPAAYNKHFLWRQSYRVVDETMSMAMCELCALLNDPLQPAKSYSNIHEWYSGTGVCHDPSFHWSNSTAEP